MNKKELLYEGKAKRVYRTDDDGVLLQEFKDSLTAFNAQKKGSFAGKGAINLKITTVIFRYLESQGIQTHFRGLAEATESTRGDADAGSADATVAATATASASAKAGTAPGLLTERLDMIPLEVVVRNRAAGSMSTRLGIAEGEKLPFPLVEFYFKKDELSDPLVTEDHIALLHAASASEVAELKKSARLINEALIKFFDEVGVDLVDFKIEFGRRAQGGEIILADEISPDSCRLWDKVTQEKLDKDRFRRDLGKVEESYQLICEKIISRWEKK